jgi:hypothetical protein
VSGNVRRQVCALALLLALSAGGAPSHAASAAEPPASWHFAPALTPPAPPGVASASEFVNVGPVGQISFWAPNRGLLIEGGTEAFGNNKTPAVPAGLYAYNGASWHQLSTVCGGGEGRIAWAGPDEFWTISDQRGGQNLPERYRGELESISLCHFLDGQVVGSYAMPLGQSDSYLRMDAAACYSPSDCWFGGETGTGANPGAFHLHWDGAGVSVHYSEEAHAVTSMVGFQGHLFEGVRLHGGGLPGEAEQPALIHTIAATGSSPFGDLYLYSPTTGELLPEYEKKGLPYVPEGLLLGTDGLGLGVQATQLWAIADPEGESYGRSPTVLRCELKACLSGTWSQLMPTPASLAGSDVKEPPAPVPGSEDAWVSLTTRGRSEGTAEVALLGPEGVLERNIPPEEAEIGRRGLSGPITCPAPGDCWMATSEGWLFHLTYGAALALDEDPSFAGVITYRPPDAGVPRVYPDSYTEEANSPLAPQAPAALPPRPSAPATVHRKGRRLVKNVHDHFLHHDKFEITFTLTGKARVSLLARRGRRVIARVRARTLRPGRHTLSFEFNPALPPTKLQFNAVPPGSSGGAGQEPAGGGGAGNTIET